MEVCVDSVESAIAFVGALPSADHSPRFPYSRYMIVIKQGRTRRSGQTGTLLEPREWWRPHSVPRFVQGGQERSRTDGSNHGQSLVHKVISNLNSLPPIVHRLPLALLASGCSQSDGISVTTDHDSSKNRLLSVLGSGDRGHEGGHPDIQRSRGRRGGLWGADDLWPDQRRNHKAVSLPARPILPTEGRSSTTFQARERSATATRQVDHTVIPQDGEFILFLSLFPSCLRHDARSTRCPATPVFNTRHHAHPNKVRR